MDLPNFLHHHSHDHNRTTTRYVSVPNSSRPHHYTDDPNSPNPRYQHHQYHHHQVHHVLPPPPRHQTPPFQPLPRPPPPAQTSPYHPPPPVHGHAYNPGQSSQFAYASPNSSHDRAVEDDHPRSSYTLREFAPAPSPRVSIRLPVDDDRPRPRLPEFDQESRQEFWVQPRVLAENLPEKRTHLPLDFDSGSQKFQLDHKPMSPFKTGNRVRHDSESSSRFRVEYVDGYEPKRREEMLRGHEDENYGRRGNFLSSPGTSFRDAGFVSNSSLSLRNLESESENYHNNRNRLAYDKELFRGGRRDVAYENQRRVHDRKVPRDAHKSSFDRGGGEISNGDRTFFVSHKREYYDSESGRYGSRGIREDAHEFNRTPRKQIQKKSALLRLQKQNHMNTASESSHYGYNSNSSPFKRRGHHTYMGNGVVEEKEEEEEEGNPVELDVSFQGNSLVAVAKTAPTSCSDVNDADLTLRDMKGGKESVADRDCLNAELTKPGDNIVNVDSSMHVANDASTSDKKMVRSEVNITSDIKDTCDASSQACLSGTNHSPETKEVQRSRKGTDLDKVGAKVGPDKPSLKVVKKKKVVKKRVKKVVRPQSQKKKKLDETVMADARIPTPSEASLIDKVGGSSSYPCPNETNMLHLGKRVEAFLVATESEEHGIDESCTNCGTEIEKNGNNLNTCLGLSSLEEIKIDKDPENAQGLHATSNNNKDLVKSHNDSSLLDLANVVDDRQSRQGGDYLLLEDELDKESSPIKLPIEDNVDSALLNSENIKMQDHRSPYCSANDTDATLDIVNGSKLSKEENPVQEKISKDTLSAKSSATVGLSSSGETAKDAHMSYHDCDRVTSLDYNNVYEVTIPRSGTVDCIIKQPSTDGSSVLPEKKAKGSPRNTKISVEHKKSGALMTRKKRTIRSQLDFSRTTNIDLDPFNVSNPATSLDAKLSLSCEDPSCEEVAVSSRGSLVDDLQPGRDLACVLHDGSSDGFPEANSIAGVVVNDGLHVTPLQCRKRRKVSASHLTVSSLTTPQTHEQPVADASIFCGEAPLTSSNVLAQQNMELDTSAKDPVCAATDLMNSENEIAVLHENKLSEGCSNAVNSENEITVLHENKLSEGCFSALGVGSFVISDELKKDDGVFMAVNDHQIEVFNEQSRREEKLGVSASKEQVIAQDETPQCSISSGIQPPDMGKSISFSIMESDNLLVKDGLPKDDFPNLPNYLSSPNDLSGATSIDEAVDFVPDSLTITSSPQTLFDVSDVHMLDATSFGQISDQICTDDEELDQKSLDLKGSEVSAQKSFSECTKSTLTSDSVTESVQSIEGKTASLTLQDSRSTSHGRNLAGTESNGQKNSHGHAVSRTFPGRPSFGLNILKKRTNSSHSNPRTWHRSVNSSACPLPGNKTLTKKVPSQKQSTERDGGKVQSTSYVRKGNSLVRKPPPPAALSQVSPSFSPVYRLNSAGSDESKRSTELDNKVDVGNPPGFSRVGETQSSGENPGSLPIQSGNKLPNCVAISSGDCTSSPSTGPLSTGRCETNSDTISSSENCETPKLVEDSPTSEAFENENVPLNSLDNQILASLNPKQIVYVKRKSNQLVASSNSNDLSAANADKFQTSSFDGYYKRKKNQLVRTTLENHTKQSVMPDDNYNSGARKTLAAISSRRSSKRRSHKVIPKTFKHSTNSLVWTLCSTESTKVNSGSLYHQKVFPHLFPWKRTTYWRSFMQNSNLIYKSSSLAISKRLLLSRERDTVYTRSINGFSLRKSKVLSVGGASLKWSKSIENRSKKANEEATLAVLAVEKKKREQKRATCISSGSKNSDNSSRKSVNGERIFRIGSSRYKMDPSRRTLQRISDDDSSRAASTYPDKDVKRSYIPRRLVIGNNEYIRIGNGNQLVRDPKKRTRILASEKVRWSLHTARLRLARKRKYCQFFTRFGKCNKDSGKCPYIHDPSKIAVCTKFLNGLCSNANCKLTHKVIPERMPDCSYFLQGLCSNKNCPYRHVNVNPKASTCEGFLRGYCADGNECRKKHSYVCPTFEATGSCPQGSKCKLHHPKSRIHGKKRKRSRGLRNARGRYFGSPDISVSESRTTVFEKHFAEDSNDGFLEGKCGDFITIDVGDDDTGEFNDSRNEQMTFYDSDTSDLELEGLDVLIKPIRIMDTSLTA